ncbi:GNAT family N-acetyltransferase [Candidatus Hydrogenedentota bacterium]
MQEATLMNRLPTPEEFLALRKSAKWLIPDPKAVTAAMDNSLFGVCVECDGQMVGMGRVVGDCTLTFYIQDLIVLPEYQRRGYGRMMMDALMQYIHENAAETAVIGLFSARGLETFYGSYGFIERPQKHLGPGMVFFEKKDIKEYS